MTTVHEPHENDNQIEFVGIVGKAGPRRTPRGLAIDVADNRERPCRWYDAVSDDPDLVAALSCGDVVKIVGKVLQTGHRPLICGTITILRKQRRKIDNS